MTDQGVEKEIEANNRRKEAGDAAAADDGTLVDIAEDAISPITDSIERSDDDDDPDAIEGRRKENNAEQSPR